MTPRQRFKATIHFRKPDVLPWLEFIIDETLIEWFKEGFPAHEVVDVSPGAEFAGGAVCLQSPKIVGFTPAKYFGCMSLLGCQMAVDLSPIPRFKEKVLRREGRYVDYVGVTGVVVRKVDAAKYTWYSMPMFLEYPVKDRQSWERYKERLNPNDPRRYPKDWQRDEYLQAFQDYQDGPTVLFITGFYGFATQIVGIRNFVTMFYKDAQLMHDMAQYWAYFTIEAVREAVETLRERIDMVFWWEDLASKQGPNVSPKIFDEVFLQRYKQVTSFLRKNGMDRIMMDSDGNTQKLLPNLIESGISGHFPLEVGSGMDARILRKEYGERLFLVGNLDKRAIAQGGATMRKEVDFKVPLLKELGGYVPCMDHVTPIDLKLDRFKEYAQYLKKYL
jgi:uroporphyrinogen decarboxylase